VGQEGRLNAVVAATLAAADALAAAAAAVPVEVRRIAVGRGGADEEWRRGRSISMEQVSRRKK